MTVLSLHPFEAKRIRIAEEDDLMVASMEEGRIIGGVDTHKDLATPARDAGLDPRGAV